MLRASRRSTDRAPPDAHPPHHAQVRRIDPHPFRRRLLQAAELDDSPMHDPAPRARCRTGRSRTGRGVGGVADEDRDRLIISIAEVISDDTYEFGVDPGLVKDGVEAHLQELLAEHIETLGEGYSLVRREYMTAIG